MACLLKCAPLNFFPRATCGINLCPFLKCLIITLIKAGSILTCIISGRCRRLPPSRSLRPHACGIPSTSQKGIMEKRILELAVEALQGQKAVVEADIEWIRAQLSGGIRAGKPAISTPAVLKRRGRTAAQRKAQSEKMKAYWAAKAGPAEKPAPVKPKKGPKRSAASKAQSERMKAYWAKWRKENESKTKA